MELVLKPKTGLVSPQYHVVYDDQFRIVHHMRDLTVPPNWAQLVQHSSELVTTKQYDLTKKWFEGQDDPTADTTLQSPDDYALSNIQGTITRSQAETFSSEGATVTSTNTTPSEGVNITPNKGVVDLTYEGETVSADDPEVTWDSIIDEAIPATSKVSEGGDTLGMPGIIKLQEYVLRRSPRIYAQRATLQRSVLTTLFCFGEMLTSPKYTMRSALTTAQSAAHQFQSVNENFDTTCNDMLHHVFSVAKEANESYTFKEMLHRDDRNQFVEAMTKDIGDHTKRKHWEIVPISQMPRGIKPIMAIWSFKRK